MSELPTALFDDCRSLNVTEGAFMNCTSLAGESPFTIIDGEKVHLYERSAHPEHFAPVSKYILCFYACTGLSDYKDMPVAWKSF